MTARVLIWVTLVGLTLVNCSPRICYLGPRWQLGNGQIPLDDALGTVTLVGLLKGSSNGLDVAEGLGTLYHQLNSYSDVKITFMIVNHNNYLSDKESIAEKVSFNVFQDMPSLNIWEQLQTSDSSLLVYKSDGRLTHYIPFTNADITGDLMKKAKIAIVDSDKKSCKPEESETANQYSIFSYNINSEESPSIYNLESQKNNPTNKEQLEETQIHVTTTPSPPQKRTSKFSFLWNFFSNFFGSSTDADAISTTTQTTTTTIPTITISEKIICTEKTRNGCKKWSARYLRQARRCCYLERKHNCEEFDERKCEKMSCFIDCCLKPIITDDQSIPAETVQLQNGM